MRDRIPRDPGRVLITPENGEAYYATMERADNPRQEGDALNKKNLLPDEVAESLGLDPAANPVPADAFEQIAAKGLRIGITVYGGTSAPSNPNNGDIWVNTSTPVKGWAYAFTEPDNATEGKVWLQASEGVALDTFADGNITISPLSARQFVGGLWVSKEAKTYTNGEWKDWITLLINGADECVDVTGGWESLAVNIYGGTSARALNVTTGDSYIELTGGGGGQGGIFVTNNKILCNGSTSLRISGEIAAYADRVKIAAMSSRSSDGVVAEWIVPGGSAGAEPKTYTDEAVLDLPAGEYYIAFSIYSTDFQYIKLNRVYLADKAGGAILPGGGTGSGEISAGAIAQAIESYLEANPIEGLTPTVQDYGAKGDGTTDDTAAFQAALAENRVVLVPGGTYKLSDTLRIDENSCMELSQDTVLQFTQTDKNGIEMPRLANFKGNHATIFVPYTFSANAIHAATDVDSAGGNNANVPPFPKWDPQWKQSRYVTDINICKMDSRGFHYSVDGDCYGKALYIKCDKADPTTFMWGVDMSGLRIAGGFTYGIHIQNIGTSWNHDMRIEAVIDGCETGVCIENCHNVHLAAAIQPRRAYSMSEVETPYAKWGIKLVDSHNVDLSQSFVWDWHLARQDSEEYTHIAMLGNCYGVVLNEPRYYESSIDVRDSIYTDTPSNLEKMTILQEPITRWFKIIEGKPYYYNGVENIPLMGRSEIQEYFVTDRVANFTDALATAKDTDGTIYNGIGYKKRARVVMNSGAVVEDADSAYYIATGFIPCKAGDVIYVSGANFASMEGVTGLVYFDANFNRIWSATCAVLMPNGSGYGTYYQRGENTADGVKIITSANLKEVGTVAFVRFTFYMNDFSDNVAISVNNEIKWEQAGFLTDGIKVKGENVIGNTVLTSPNGKKFVLTVSDSGTLSAIETN